MKKIPAQVCCYDKGSACVSSFIAIYADITPVIRSRSPPPFSPLLCSFSPPCLYFHSTFIPRYLPFVLALLPCFCDKGRNWRVRRSTRRVRQSMCNKSAQASRADPCGHLMMDKWTSWVTWCGLLGPRTDRSFLPLRCCAFRLLQLGEGSVGTIPDPRSTPGKCQGNCRGW